MGTKMLDEEKKPKTIKVVYIEPPEYIPEDLRKKYKLGEYAESGSDDAKNADKATDTK